MKTGVGYPQLSCILECADAAHGLGGHIISVSYNFIVLNTYPIYYSRTVVVQAPVMSQKHLELVSLHVCVGENLSFKEERIIQKVCFCR